ncbi:MAG: MarR family transcriptional regulator [Gammaproteobacteria bacterium]|nr:MarR family transcriptional regulator [Gammaproteobacteria bacterium]
MLTPLEGPSELVHGRSADPRSKKSLRVWLQLIKCAKRIEQEMSARFRTSYASSMSRFDVLAHLYEAGGKGLSTTQLATRLLASKGNITRLLDRMEEDGLIQRRPNASDRRISDIFLSPKGRKLFAGMAPAHEQWSNDVFDVLTDAEKDTLVELLVRVRTRLKRATDLAGEATAAN